VFLFLFTVFAFITISFAIKSSVCRADISMSLLDDKINRPSSADRLNKKSMEIFLLNILSIYLKFLSELIEFVTRCGISNRF